MLPLAIAIFMHESAHLVALKLLDGRIKSFGAAPFGLCIEYDENTLTVGGEAIVSVAGCAINLLSFALSFVTGVFVEFGAVSLALAMINLIPTMPLDGGRLISIAITAIKGPDTAYRFGAAISYLFGFLIFLLASYMLLTSQCGIYPLLFSVYLFGNNAKMIEMAVLGEKTSI